MSARIQTYAELQTLIRKALREQHPEWVDTGGKSALCESYEVRLAYLVGVFASVEAGAEVPLFHAPGNGDDPDAHEMELPSTSNSRREIQ